MRKLKDVLRLRLELGLSHRQIARSCSIGLGTVHDYLQRAEAAGVKWPLPEGWDERQLEAALLAARQPGNPPKDKEESAARVREDPRATPEAPPSDIATAVGGIQASEP